MYSDENIRESLAERGVTIVDRGPRKQHGPRLIKTTYYRYGVPGGTPESVAKTTYSCYLDTACRSAFYNLLNNKYEAGVVEIVDEGNFHELCSVLTRDIEGNIATVFKRDPKRPKLVTPGV